jgi:lipopolysaccharide export system protein LptA
VTKLAKGPAFIALACTGLLFVGAAAGQSAERRERNRSPVGAFGQNSRQPINVEADELRVLQHENKAVYKGKVVAVQGDTTMRCTQLTVFFEAKGGGAKALAEKRTSSNGEKADKTESAIRRLECAGPVSVTAKDQVATANNAVYDRVAGQVTLIGNVALSQGGNVTRGERMVYDINSGIARVEGGRVRGLFIPGSGGGGKR